MENDKQKWREQFLKAFNPYSTNEVIEKALREKNRKIPEKLFRYRSYHEDHPEYLESEMDGELCFQPHSNLNDPFDGSVMQKHDDPIDYLREHQYLRNKVLDMCNQNIKQLDDASDEEYQSILKNTEKSIVEINERFKSALDYYAQIVCFTEDFRNQLMWSHYANSHKGYCFEYDTSKLDDSNKKLLLPVCYVEKLYDYIDVYLHFANIHKQMQIFPEDIDFNNFLGSFVITKLMDWSYENEWRLIMAYPELTDLIDKRNNSNNNQENSDKPPISKEYKKLIDELNEHKGVINLSAQSMREYRHKFMEEQHSINIIKPTAVYLGVNIDKITDKTENKINVKEQIINKARENQIPVYQMEASTKGLHPILVYEPTK